MALYLKIINGVALKADHHSKSDLLITFLSAIKMKQNFLRIRRLVISIKFISGVENLNWFLTMDRQEMTRR